MKVLRKLSITALIVTMLAWHPMALAQTANELFQQGQDAYNAGEYYQAIEHYKQSIQADGNLLDAYYNLGAVYYKLKRYPEALGTFNALLQKNPNDMPARFNTGKVYEQLGRYNEAIAAFEMISPESSRYGLAQDRIRHLHHLKAQRQQQGHHVAQHNPHKPAIKRGPRKPQPQQQPKKEQPKKVAATPVKKKPQPATPAKKKPTGKPFQVVEVANGFAGPTGITVDPNGMLYVANYSKHSIYKVTESGQKTLFVTGSGIQGPVGMVLDPKTGDLYVANYLANSIAKVTPGGQVSIIAKDLKKPYNIFLDNSTHTLYVSQQETNSVAKIQLN